MQSNEHLEKEASKDEIHQSQLASVGQIAAGIAHEVRNPLTAVKGFLHLMKEKNDDRYIDIAQSELNNALLTLENLLHVSKPDLEDEPYESIHLAVELESVLHLFQDQVYRVKVETDFRDADKNILGKRNQIKKALFNLLKNSFEAISEQGAITLSHYTTDTQIVVTIRDTGTGIPKEKLMLLGTPFFTTKQNGTGMGLTQVFSVIYQHGGTIKVESEPQVGTTFRLFFPLKSLKIRLEVTELNLNYSLNLGLKEFFLENKQRFEERLLNQAVNVKDKIEEIQTIGNINLVNNAHKLVLFLVDGREHEIMSFAKEEGEVWAKFSLTLAFKLEWIQAIRRVLWDFLYNYDRLSGKDADREAFYEQEKRINTLVDLFLNYFFMSYSTFKDDMIKTHREMVEDLSVPLIPLTQTMCILPLVGTIDSFRANTIIDKVLAQIGIMHTQTLFLDLSGVMYMDTNVINHIIKMIDGISMMGCKAVITGIRPEIVKTMIGLGISLSDKADTKGTLQQAMIDYLGLSV